MICVFLYWHANHVFVDNYLIQKKDVLRVTRLRKRRLPTRATRGTRLGLVASETKDSECAEYDQEESSTDYVCIPMEEENSDARENSRIASVEEQQGCYMY